MTTHNWSDGGQFCSCDADTVTCQGCGRLVCSTLAVWFETASGSRPKGNIGTCCWSRFGLGHAGPQDFPDKVGKDHAGDICVRFNGAIQRPRFTSPGAAEAFLSGLLAGYRKPEPEDRS